MTATLRKTVQNIETTNATTSATTTATATATVLVVEDDPALREALIDTLQLAGFETLEAASAEAALELLGSHNAISMIVSDVNMSGMNGHDLLKTVCRQYPHIPMVLITAYASIANSVDAMRDGAVDYLVKPFKPELLVKTVRRYCSSHSAPDEDLVAEDPASEQLLRLAARVAQSDSTVLLLGESGTGKEVLARYIHQNSQRSHGPFIAVNCAAIPENMLEAMLFGYEKGAYTGAHTASPGKFELADGGTLLLDEISEMDIGLQAKLLRVLQEREVERLGARRATRLDVRVIATSNRNIRQEVTQGKFREDLYFRLSVLPLQWAPLRDRLGDILPLAQKLLERHAQRQHRHGVQLSPVARQTLLDYPWPGNVRELDNTMQRALILQPGVLIQPEDLGLGAEREFSPKPDLEQSMSYRTATPAQALEDGALVDEPERLNLDLRQREFEIILKALREAGGSKKKTAERLGLSARTLRYKVAKLRDLGFPLEGD